MTIAKRVSCIVLCLVVCFCICFQCSINSYAVFGVDDALLIGAICLDLAACGVTIYSVSQFVQSDTFADFTHQLGADIDRQISVVKRNGELFFATTKLGWSMITNWVKNHFSGATEDKTITYDVELSTSPEFLILSDGTSVPYAEFMDLPFFVYRNATTGVIRCFYCNVTDCGMTVGSHLIQIYCVGAGQYGSAYIDNGAWHDNGFANMAYGLTVKGHTGSVVNLSFDDNIFPSRDGFFLFRSMDIWATSNGEVNTNFPPSQTVPDGTSTQTASVDMHSDGLKYPGAIDSPTTTIKEGESVLVKVPEGMVVDNGNGDLTLTTNSETVGQVIADTTAGEVDARVLTSELTDTEIVEQIIEDTPAQEISGNAQADIETANKFRLPKSFLEGFPFSIPYSIFCGIKSFLAQGEAPVYNVPISIPRLGIDEKITIDLNQFNPLARLCRALLSVVWVAGLAMTCGSLIKQ